MSRSFPGNNPNGLAVPLRLVQDGAGEGEVQYVGILSPGGFIHQSKDLPCPVFDSRLRTFEKLGIGYFQHMAQGAGHLPPFFSSLQNTVLHLVAVATVALLPLPFITGAAVVIVPFFPRDQEGESDPGIKFFLSAMVSLMTE